MKKYIITVIVLVIVLPLAWYLISPIWNVRELQEASPLVKALPQETPPQTEPITKEDITVTPEAKEQFRKEMEKAQVLPPKVMDDVTPIWWRTVAHGEFVARAHEVAGTAQLIENDTTRILRFENFETINGPDLHIYLATDTSATDSIDLGPIRATKGNVNYSFPDNVDLTKYNTVLVWCVPFRVLFSSAELK